MKGKFKNRYICRVIKITKKNEKSAKQSVSRRAKQESTSNKIHGEKKSKTVVHIASGKKSEEMSRNIVKARYQTVTVTTEDRKY